ncbi:hypothetical protein [Kangiella marina]|uniref:Lysozyme inhibitor LprI N-terminal domain-containing protein n=1 Tax=Kangiella marina TaxID=1079178 RepID=A0ABP8IK59_9GAMM
MMKKITVIVLLILIAELAMADSKEVVGSETEKSSQNNIYHDYIVQTKKLIDKKFPGYFKELTKGEQLQWIDYVGRQGAKFGYDNISLRQGYTIIACYLGKDFMTDQGVDKNIKRFLQDERFSKYVRIRDMQRYLEKKNYKLNKPSIVE